MSTGSAFAFAVNADTGTIIKRMQSPGDLYMWFLTTARYEGWRLRDRNGGHLLLRMPQTFGGMRAGKSWAFKRGSVG